MVNASQYVRTKICSNLQETYDFAKEMAQFLTPGMVIALYGGLGAGKTAFTQGIALALGVEEPVISPTYALWQTYQGDLTLHHFDLYRLDTPEQVYSIGFEDAINSDGVTLIEWPERLEDQLPTPRLEVYIERMDDEKRCICLRGIV